MQEPFPGSARGFADQMPVVFTCVSYRAMHVCRVVYVGACPASTRGFLSDASGARRWICLTVTANPVTLGGRGGLLGVRESAAETGDAGEFFRVAFVVAPRSLGKC